MVGFTTKGRVLTLTVGLPASGKTEWALSSGFDATVCLDDCRKELWGDAVLQDGPGGIAALLSYQDEKITKAISEGKSIVVHNTHPLRSYREPLIAMARQAGYRVQIVYFDVDPGECRRRNNARKNPVPETVMDEFIVSLEMPTDDEADEIIVL